jgi:hypothetical protein
MSFVLVTMIFKTFHSTTVLDARMTIATATSVVIGQRGMFFILDQTQSPSARAIWHLMQTIVAYNSLTIYGTCQK